MADMPRMLARYSLLETLGRGSVGVVWLAKDTVLHRDVALKVIEPTNGDPDAAATLKLFVREARTIAQLDHSHIVRIYDITRSQGRVGIAMELCAGGSLADRIREHGPLSWREACAIIADAAEGLAHAHQQGIVHRDVKPANLMLVQREGGFGCKVVDFGLARRLNQRDAKHLRDRVVGTPYYIAPEQIRLRDATPASDLYSLGITLWVAVTGAPTFEARTVRRMYRQHLKSPVPDLTQLAPDTPPALADLLESLLAKDPKHRPTDAGNVARQLRLIADQPTAPRKPRVPVKRQRTYAGTIGSVVAALLLIVIAGITWWTSPPPPPPEVPPEVPSETLFPESPPPKLPGVSQLEARDVLIDEGQLTDRVIQQGIWTTYIDMIEGEGVDSVLVMQSPVTGDARVRIRLALSEIKGTIASLRIDERSVFCFDGRGSVLYVNGPVFGRRRTLKLDDTQHHIQPNVPFDLKLVRRDGELAIAINDREVYRGQDDRIGLGTLSLHPRRNVMRVYAWSVERLSGQ